MHSQSVFKRSCPTVFFRFFKNTAQNIWRCFFVSSIFVLSLCNNCNWLKEMRQLPVPFRPECPTALLFIQPKPIIKTKTMSKV
jgi:hypothetical protein